MPSSSHHRNRSRSESAAWDLRGAEAALWLLLFAVALVVVPTAQDAFRLPKLLVAEVLALVSLALLAARLRSRERVEPKDVVEPPVIRAVVPFLVIATLGLVWTGHGPAVREGLADLWIGAAALVGWSLGLPRERLRRLLAGLVLPAALLAALAILQIHDVAQPLGFLGLENTARMAWTSLAGNPGDLAGFLALAAVAAQAEVLRRRGAGRWTFIALLAIVVYALVATRTLGGIAAVAVGSGVFWLLVVPKKRLLPLAVGSLAALVTVMALAGPVRQRLGDVAEAVREGDWNAVLTGRLDGWRTALWMTAEHPLTGVGHGAYGSVYGDAKRALAEEGVAFSRAPQTAVFSNAHNEPLEVTAETGLPGLAALAFGAWVLLGRARRVDPGPGSPGDSGLAWGGLAALGVLSLIHFPFRIALTAYPAILWGAWIFRAAGEPEGEAS